MEKIINNPVTRPKMVRVLRLALIVAMAAGCGGLLDKEKAYLETSPGASIELVWPEGFSYDSATGRLETPSGETYKSAPAYVTGVSLTVSGEGMETMNIGVPLDTLRVSVTLSFGERKFDILVNTDIGLTFTATQKVKIAPGIAPVIRFALEVNAPPVISGLTVSKSSPKKGETVTVSAAFGDMDPEDTLSYKWSVTDRSGAAMGFTEAGGEGFSDISILIDRGGEIAVDFIVEDGLGGVAKKTVLIRVVNEPPQIKRTISDKTYVKAGDTVNLYCEATDPDNDPLSYFWFAPNGWSAKGQQASYAFQGAGDTKLTCEVDDGAGGFASGYVLLNSGQNPRAAGACSSDFSVADVGINLDWAATVDLDIEVLDPNGKRIWYGNLRPEGGAELCVDVSCATAPGIELAFWKAGSSPALGTYTVKVTYFKDCSGAGAALFNIFFQTQNGYMFNSVLRGATPIAISPPVNTASDSSVSISPGQTIVYTFVLI